MDRGKKNILCINGGSSSIKFSVYGSGGEDLIIVLNGKIERIGLAGASLSFKDILSGEEGRVPLKEPGMKEAANFLMEWLESRVGNSGFSAIGHRVVHGGTRRQPAVIDDKLLAELDRISGYDPDHLPAEI